MIGAGILVVGLLFFVLAAVAGWASVAFARAHRRLEMGLFAFIALTLGVIGVSFVVPVA